MVFKQKYAFFKYIKRERPDSIEMLSEKYGIVSQVDLFEEGDVINFYGDMSFNLAQVSLLPLGLPSRLSEYSNEQLDKLYDTFIKGYEIPKCVVKELKAVRSLEQKKKDLISRISMN